MKLLSTWFLPAMALSSASAAASVTGGGQVHGLAARDGARHDAVDQRAARGLADHRQHVGFVRGVDADVAGMNSAGFRDRGQGAGRRLHQHGRAPVKKSCRALAALAGG
jgi:hypothetical protein